MTRFLIIFFTFFCVIATSQPWAAKPTGLSKPETKPEVYDIKSPIEQAQEMLKQQGLYEGKVDGIKGPDLEKAIREYQKSHGLKQTGKITNDLLAHLENIGRVRALIKRLDVVRAERQEAARLALMSDPRTRKLLEQKENEVADPTRDVSHCFASPSTKCLLQEAVESSRAVFEDDLRDWALGEILAAQVRVGMENDAMETAARIKDSRLVIAALTNIAKTHAREGKLSEALSGIGLIPVAERRLSVLLEVAQVYKDMENSDKLLSTLNKILAGSQSVESLEDRVPLQIKAAELLASVDKKRALDILDGLSDEARTSAKNGSRVTLLRQTASAMANIDYPEWALKALDEMPDDETRVPVLMSATRAFLKMKRFEAARNTLARIAADRYRSVILSDLALALWESRRRDKADEALAKAESLANGIKLPFAKNFALSKVAGVMVKMASDTRNSDIADRAYALLTSITDGRLRARGLWELAHASDRHDFSMTKGNLDEAVTDAMNNIKSKFSRAWILGDLAFEHQETGEKDQARKAFKMGLDTAQNLKNPWARSRALAKFGAVFNRLD